MNSAFQAFQGPAETHISIAATGGIPLLPCFHNAKPAGKKCRDASIGKQPGETSGMTRNPTHPPSCAPK